MIDFLSVLGSFFTRLIDTLDFPLFSVGVGDTAWSVSFVRLLIGFIVLSAIIVTFWKGARG